MYREHTIYVFRTNIKTERDLHILGPILDEHPQIREWTVDTQDVDCVLRIVAYTLRENDLINLLKEYDYYCAELV
jgi:hypothetical protein